MNLRHKAALALVGWYLMVPPAFEFRGADVVKPVCGELLIIRTNQQFATHKFIENNGGLVPLSSRSRDNLPNPIAASGNPYVPTNGPAIGDLMTVFDFAHRRSSPPLIIPGGI